MGLSEDAKFAGKMLQKSAKAEGATIGVILSILPFGSRPWSKLFENCTALLLKEQTDVLQKKAERVSALCAWHMVQSTEPSTSTLENQSIDPLGSVCFLKLNCSGMRVKAAFLDVFVFFFQAPTETTFGKYFPSSWLIYVGFFNWVLNYLSNSGVCFLSEKFLLSRKQSRFYKSSTLLKRHSVSKLAYSTWHQKRKFRILVLINSALLSIRKNHFLLGRFSKIHSSRSGDFMLSGCFWNSRAKIHLFLVKQRFLQRITVINYDRDLLSLVLFAGVFCSTSYNPFRKKYFLLSKNSINWI